MAGNSDDLKNALEGLPSGVQDQIRNLMQLAVSQQQEIERLREQLGGFMSIGGPAPSQLADAFRGAVKNSYRQEDAEAAVAELKADLQKRDRWISAALRSFQIAREVVSVIK